MTDKTSLIFRRMWQICCGRKKRQEKKSAYFHSTRFAGLSRDKWQRPTSGFVIQITVECRKTKQRDRPWRIRKSITNATNLSFKSNASTWYAGKLKRTQLVSHMDAVNKYFYYIYFLILNIYIIKFTSNSNMITVMLIKLYSFNGKIFLSSKNAIEFSFIHFWRPCPRIRLLHFFSLIVIIKQI